MNPNIEVSVVWVNSWFDPAKEQEAAKALLAQGCDVIFSNAQDTPSVISVCEEAGVPSFNLKLSMNVLRTKTYLGCVATDWSPFFKASVDAHVAGTFQGANAFLGVADKVVEVVGLEPGRAADLMAKIKEVEATIADGSFSPFTGPITKADGSEGVAAGTTLTDDQIVALDWHVKGVARRCRSNAHARALLSLRGMTKKLWSGPSQPGHRPRRGSELDPCDPGRKRRGQVHVDEADLWG